MIKTVSTYRSDIQVLRGLSVLSVIFYHANSNLFKFGYLGVDIFFVISGFVILPALAKNLNGRNQKKFKLREFYKRRFLRLYPGLVSSLILSSIVLWLFFSPEYHDRISRQGIASLFFIGNIGALIYSGDYFAPNPNPLVHLWSLAVEAQIYFALPLILIAFLKIKIKIEITLVYLTVLSMIFFAFPFLSESIFSWFGFPYKDQASFYLSFDRFWQFSVGGLCGILQMSRIVQKFKSKLNYYSAIFICSIIIFLEINNQKIGSVFATLLAITLIIGQRLTHKNLKWLISIGDRSYSLYLIHMPIFAVINYSPVTTYLIGNNKLFHLVFGLIVTFLLSNVNYNYFEQSYRLNSSVFKVVRVKLISVGLLFSACMALFVQLNITSAASLEKFNSELNIKADAWDLDPDCERMTNNGPPCLYNLGIAKSPTLLIGDSHAAQYSQTLVDLGLAGGFPVVIWTQAGCPFTLKHSLNRNLPEKCIENNEIKMKWILDNKPTNVIISYFMGPDHDVKSLLESINIVKSNVESVILIENNPVFPDKDKFLQLLPKIMKPYSNPKIFRQEEMVSVNDMSTETLYAGAKKNGIVTIDLSSQICKFGLCSRWLNGEWLYGDDNHLSTTGAEMLKPLLSKVIK